MLKFKYKNKEYTILFYPCGLIASITEKSTNKTREIKFNKNTSIVHFLNALDKIQF
ncbi:MAG: hypothetical protein J6A52_04180 [Bacilli bacterium]|nr:hypothetical protein [Bacilli bacterium]